MRREELHSPLSFPSFSTPPATPPLPLPHGNHGLCVFCASTTPPMLTRVDSMSQLYAADEPVLTLWLQSISDEFILLFEVNGAVRAERPKHRYASCPSRIAQACQLRRVQTLTHLLRRRTASRSARPKSCSADSTISAEGKKKLLRHAARTLERAIGDSNPSSRSETQVESVTCDSEWSFIATSPNDRRHDLDPYSPTPSTSSVLSDTDYLHNFT